MCVCVCVQFGLLFFPLIWVIYSVIADSDLVKPHFICYCLCVDADQATAATMLHTSYHIYIYIDMIVMWCMISHVWYPSNYLFGFFDCFYVHSLLPFYSYLVYMVILWILGPQHVGRSLALLPFGRMHAVCIVARAPPTTCHIDLRTIAHWRFGILFDISWTPIAKCTMYGRRIFGIACRITHDNDKLSLLYDMGASYTHACAQDGLFHQKSFIDLYATHRSPLIEYRIYYHNHMHAQCSMLLPATSHQQQRQHVTIHEWMTKIKNTKIVDIFWSVKFSAISLNMQECRLRCDVR